MPLILRLQLAHCSYSVVSSLDLAMNLVTFAIIAPVPGVNQLCENLSFVSFLFFLSKFLVLLVVEKILKTSLYSRGSETRLQRNTPLFFFLNS